MRKPIRRSTGKKKPGPTAQPQDEVVRLLEDMSLTLNEILELLQRELEEDEPEQPHPATQPQGPV